MVITEFGAPMQTSLHYADEVTKNRRVVFMRSSTEIIKNWNLGNIYWPGLRDGDDFSILMRDSANNLTITNNSGLNLIIESF